MGGRRHRRVRTGGLLAASALAVLAACGNGAAGPTDGGGDPVSPPDFGTTDWPDEEMVARSGNVFEDNRRREVWIVP